MQLVVDGVLTNYLDINPKNQKTLIILHGWGSSLQYWIPLTKLLSKDLRIILVDLPGFGSTQPLSGSPDVPEYTEFIKKFTEKLKLEKFILAGHSFGSLVTLDYGIKYPDNLQSIILISPAVVSKISDETKIKVRLAETIKPLLSSLPNRQFEEILGWYTPQNYTYSNEYQKMVLEKIIKYNLVPKIKSLSVPTDIIWGPSDIVIPETEKSISQKIPNSHLHIIEGAGHLIHLTHPEELSQTINQITKS